jgi:hypothetical protein
MTPDGLAPAIYRFECHVSGLQFSVDAGPEHVPKALEREPYVQVQQVLTGDFGLAYAPEILRPLIPGENPQLAVHHRNAALQAREDRLEEGVR